MSSWDMNLEPFNGYIEGNLNYVDNDKEVIVKENNQNSQHGIDNSNHKINNKIYAHTHNEAKVYSKVLYQDSLPTFNGNDNQVKDQNIDRYQAVSYIDNDSQEEKYLHSNMDVVECVEEFQDSGDNDLDDNYIQASDVDVVLNIEENLDPIGHYDVESKSYQNETNSTLTKKRKGSDWILQQGGRKVKKMLQTFGSPLKEMWKNDADIPSEIVDLIKDSEKNQRVRTKGVPQITKMKKYNNGYNWCDDGKVFHDVDERGKPHLEGKDLNFEWSPVDSFQCQEETFRMEHTGSVVSYSTEYDAFRSFWDDSILKYIADQTNIYASRIQSNSFKSEWFPTNSDEILCLFAFWMMLGIIRMPTIASCFSSNPMLKNVIFTRIFSQGRYGNLTRSLHFFDANPSNSTNKTAIDNHDRLSRLKPIINHLNDKFQSNYVLSQNISIDESLTPWKGRLDIKQCIKKKVAKFGIKTFELCESTTGYLWSFIVHSGKQSDDEVKRHPLAHTSFAVVKALVKPLLNKGYRLFMDNWSNSPILARWLKRNGTDCVGTLNPYCSNVPPFIRHAPLNRDEYIARQSGDVCLLAWQDKRRVTMISTCHGSATALPTVRSNLNLSVPFKPQVVLDYNKYMVGVDLKDQMLAPYSIEQKRCSKWFMKLFKRLLNISILNSRILLQSSRTSISQKHQDHLSFRLNLVESILQKHLSLSPLIQRREIHVTQLPQSPREHQVHNTHWLTRLPRTPCDIARNRKSSKICVVCRRNGRKFQKTPFMCEACKVPLCVECMKPYHMPSIKSLTL